MSSKFKNFCFTEFNLTQERVSWWKGLLDGDAQFVAFGQEICPTTGRNHLQGFMCFKNPRGLLAIQKMCYPTHVEACKGSLRQNERYCSKEGQYEKYGEEPMEPGKHKIDWGKVIEETKLGHLDAVVELAPSYYASHYNVLKKIAADHVPVPGNRANLDNYWIFGPTGTGKSKLARSMLDNDFWLAEDGWFTSVAGARNLLVDDVDHVTRPSLRNIKLWTDHYPFQANIKGGGQYIRPDRVVFTSQLHPYDYFKDDPKVSMEDIKALKRRFMLIEFTDVDQYQEYKWD